MVVANLALPGQGQVRVAVLLSQEVVVVGVVAAEGERTGDTHRHVAEHCHDVVDMLAFVTSTVGEVVDAAVECVVEGAADEVCVNDEQPDRLVLNAGGSTLAQ